MATLTDTIPNITYADDPVITAVTGYTFDTQMESYDSSAVEYNGEVTYLLEKTSSQINWTADENFGGLEANSNNVLDSSLVEYTGQLTGYQIKTSSQSNLNFNSYAIIEIENNTLTQEPSFTGQLQFTIVKVSSAIPFTGFTHASSSFGEGTGASTTTGTGPTQDDSYEILIQ
jgi:hypothetical protein